MGDENTALEGGEDHGADLEVAGTGAGVDTGVGAAGEGVQPPAPQKVELTEDTIKALVGSLPGPPALAAAPQPERQMTQEELDKAMNVFRVTPQHMKALGLSEEAAEYMNEIVTGAVRQAVTMAMLAQRKLQTDLEGRLTPLQKYMNEANEQKLRAEFFSKHEDLKDVETLVEAVYSRLSTSGVQFKTKDEAFKAIADQTRQLLAKLRPVGQGGGGDGGTATKPANKMSTVTTGGRGGAGQSRSAPKIDKGAMAMFG